VISPPDSRSYPVKVTNKTDLQDVTEILLKVALNTITSISNRKSGIIDREIYMYRICSVV
jgi:hypothetical protein